jgi:hypothetical protein
MPLNTYFASITLIQSFHARHISTHVHSNFAHLIYSWLFLSSGGEPFKLPVALSASPLERDVSDAQATNIGTPYSFLYRDENALVAKMLTHWQITAIQSQSANYIAHFPYRINKRAGLT